MPESDPVYQAALDALAAEADEQVRDVFRRLPGLKAEAIAKKVEMLLEHKEWRAVAEGIKLRARIAGDFAPEEVRLGPQRAEDLGQMDDVLAQLPPETLMALVHAARKRENGEE